MTEIMKNLLTKQMRWILSADAQKERLQIFAKAIRLFEFAKTSAGRLNMHRKRQKKRAFYLFLKKKSWKREIRFIR